MFFLFHLFLFSYWRRNNWIIYYGIKLKESASPGQKGTSAAAHTILFQTKQNRFLLDVIFDIFSDTKLFNYFNVNISGNYCINKGFIKTYFNEVWLAQFIAYTLHYIYVHWNNSYKTFVEMINIITYYCKCKSIISPGSKFGTVTWYNSKLHYPHIEG